MAEVPRYRNPKAKQRGALKDANVSVKPLAMPADRQAERDAVMLISKAKALTLSYDDGVEQDKRLISILNKHGMKCTFNLNSGVFAPEGTVYPKGQVHRRMTEKEVYETYSQDITNIVVANWLKKIVDKYNEEFSKLDFIQLPPDGEGNAWHLYLMRLNLNKLTISREDFAKKMQEAGLGISVHFIPLFHFSYWKSLDCEFTAEKFPNAESQYSRTISIPLFPDMTQEQVDFVIETIKIIGRENHA